MSRIISTIIILIACTLSILAANYSLGSDKGVICTWVKDDVAGIYTTGGTRIKHWAETIDDDAHHALFSSRAWALTANTDYYAYYPYSSYYFDNNCPITALPVSYENQTQSGNDDMKHLAAYDFMIAKGQTTASAAEFSMRHLGSILRIEITLPQDKATLNLTAVKLSLPTTAAIPLKATMNLPEQKLVAETSAKELTLRLESITLGSDNTLRAYMMIPPFTCYGENPTLTIYANDKAVLTQELLATEFTEGHCYNICPSAPSAAKGTINKEKTPNSLTSSLQTPLLHATDFTPETIIIPTSIGTATTTSNSSTAKCFTPGGKQASPSTKGIIISNGRKHIRK